MDGDSSAKPILTRHLTAVVSPGGSAQTMDEEKPATASVRAAIRDDFMRRIFAVAVSVGFATTLSNSAWLKHQRLPNGAEIQQFAVLLTALTATLLSWDGYLASIAKKPLERSTRFVIDIALVFIYMTLLLTASNPHWWLAIIVVIFGLYFMWDVLSVREHFHAYRVGGAPEGKSASAGQIAAVYRDGFLNGDDVAKGPIVTALWWLYFIGLFVADGLNVVPYQLWAMCAFALAGLFFYRYEKAHALRSWPRACSIVGLLIGLNLLMLVLKSL